VEVRVHGGLKRKSPSLVHKGIGKDMKRVRAELFGSRSTSGIRKPEACLIKLLDTLVHHYIDIDLP